MCLLVGQVTWAGVVLCWGNNTSGQCGLPPSEAAFVCTPRTLQLPHAAPFAREVTCGFEHAVAISTSGSLVCWGSNSAGQLGEPLSFQLSTEEQEGGMGGVGGGAFAVAASYTPMCIVCERSGQQFSQVACGRAHTVALTSDGKVFAWGCNTSGQCAGLEELPTTPRSAADASANTPSPPAPLPSTHPHPAYGEADGRGQDTSGGKERGNRQEETQFFRNQVVLDSVVRRVAAGANFTLLVTNFGLVSFGANGFGQLGRETNSSFDSTPAPVDLSCSSHENTRIEPGEGGGGWVWDLQGGDDHSVLLLRDASVLVWGRGTQVCVRMYVCVCVCARTRTRACVCV